MFKEPPEINKRPKPFEINTAAVLFYAMSIRLRPTKTKKGDNYGIRGNQGQRRASDKIRE
jgi:hypothetical protein